MCPFFSSSILSNFHSGRPDQNTLQATVSNQDNRNKTQCSQSDILQKILRPCPVAGNQIPKASKRRKNKRDKRRERRIGKTMDHLEPRLCSINPLSNPKGVKLLCELCGKVAYFQCLNCRVSYYCTKEHHAIDWNGIHEKICQKLIPLRTPSNALGTEEERRKREKQTHQAQRALLELSKNEAMKSLHQSKFEPAIPAALQALRFSLDIYGAGSIELVPSYLLLGEASIGLNRYQQAEEYLSLAKWSVLKSPECSNTLKSQLHRNFGKLYASQGKSDESLKELANDVYYMSSAMGPEHIRTSGGYYQMANVFHSIERVEQALALYAKVVDIWYKYLTTIHQDPVFAATEGLDEVQATEALQMLFTIRRIRQQSLSENHPAVGESFYVLSLLFQYLGDTEKSKENAEQSLGILESELGHDHASVQEVRGFMEKFHMAAPPPKVIETDAAQEPQDDAEPQEE